MELKANDITIFALLVTALLLIDSLIYANMIDAAPQGKLTACLSCHPVLSETLPKVHEPITDSNPISCKRCHTAKGSAKTFEWVLHFKHYSVADTEISCTACHLVGKEENFGASGGTSQLKVLPHDIVGQWESYIKLWATSGYMDNEHAQKGIFCGPCHGAVFTFQLPSLEQCLGCHKKYNHTTAQNSKGVPNPHQSHLEDPPCTLCHKAHEESVNYCNRNGCHNFDFKFPYPNTK